MVKSKLRKYIFMGPLAPPFTGQSVAFTTFVGAVKDKLNYKVLNISNRNNISCSIFLYFEIIVNIIFKNTDAIYFTCSRTLFGSTRDVLLLFLSRLKQIRVVNHLHGSDFKEFYRSLPKVYRKLLYWCYSGIDTTIILTEGMEEEFTDFPKMKTIVISNCYSNELDNLPKRKDVIDLEVHLLYFSNIMRSKGIIHLLKACDILFSKHNNLKLDIAGNLLGDSISSLKEISTDFFDLLKILQLKYPERIKYYGESKGMHKTQLLWQSDIFILPTFYRTEAFPISILEAMRAGNYILSTNHRYIPQIITKQNGSLVEAKSTIEIINEVEKVISNITKMRQIQNNNILHVIKNYNEEKYVKSICDILETNN